MVKINVLCNMGESAGKHSLPRCIHTQKKNYLILLQQSKNLVHLSDRFDEPHCFRLHKDHVFNAYESSMKLVISAVRPNLVSSGTCSGKFSKSR